MNRQSKPFIQIFLIPKVSRLESDYKCSLDMANPAKDSGS